MKLHPIMVEGFSGTPKELAEAVGKTRYDFQTEFFKGLEGEYLRQARNDRKINKKKLAKRLLIASLKARVLREELEDIVVICKHYIEEEKRERKRIERERGEKVGK